MLLTSTQLTKYDMQPTVFRRHAQKKHSFMLLFRDIQSVPGGMCQTSGGCSLC